MIKRKLKSYEAISEISVFMHLGASDWSSSNVLLFLVKGDSHVKANNWRHKKRAFLSYSEDSSSECH